MLPSKEHLLTVVRQYWPVDKTEDGSDKYKILTDLWDQVLKRHEQWWSLLDELENELPGFTSGDATATPDACLRCTVYSPRHAGLSKEPRFIVVGCVSILAPVYTVYGVEFEQFDQQRHNTRVFFESLPASMRRPAEVISRSIETRYKVSLLPRELARLPVPLFIEPLKPPDTTLFHALFTSEPESLP